MLALVLAIEGPKVEAAAAEAVTQVLRGERSELQHALAGCTALRSAGMEGADVLLLSDMSVQKRPPLPS